MTFNPKNIVNSPSKVSVSINIMNKIIIKYNLSHNLNRWNDKGSASIVRNLSSGITSSHNNNVRSSTMNVSKRSFGSMGSVHRH